MEETFELNYLLQRFPGGSEVNNLPVNAGNVGLIPGLGRSAGEGNGNPLQCSWKFPGAGEPRWLHSPRGFERVAHNLATKQQ